MESFTPFQKKELDSLFFAFLRLLSATFTLEAIEATDLFERFG
jgi:hypothetical protein